MSKTDEAMRQIVKRAAQRQAYETDEQTLERGLDHLYDTPYHP